MKAAFVVVDEYAGGDMHWRITPSFVSALVAQHQVLT
jgi:hypothetical protein